MEDNKIKKDICKMFIPGTLHLEHMGRVQHMDSNIACCDTALLADTRHLQCSQDALLGLFRNIYL